jgi:pSer/pThr/pTyr-binding forkhead associated (FHA) protein
MRLTLQSVGVPQRRIILEELPALIGRGAGAEVSVDDSWVGQFQCILDREGDRVRVLDLGSRNGTFVNGVRIQRVELLPGDVLTVGRTDFVVQYERIRDGAAAPQRALAGR